MVALITNKFKRNAGCTFKTNEAQLFRNIAPQHFTNPKYNTNYYFGFIWLVVAIK